MKQLLFFLLLSVTATAQSIDWDVEDVTFAAGDTVQARFQVYGFQDIGAIQFALKADTAKLQFDGLSFTGALPGYSAECFSWYGLPGYALTPGEIRTVWSDPYGATVADGSEVFSVRFIAKSPGTLHENLWLWSNHPVLKPLAYYSSLQSAPITVSFFSTGLSDTWTPQTDAPVQVEIYDQHLRLVQQSVRADLRALDTGIYYIRTTQNHQSRTKSIFKQ